MVAPTGVVVHRCMYVDQAKEKKDFSLMDDGRRVYYCTTYENPTEEQHRFHLRGYSAQHDTARYIAHTQHNTETQRLPLNALWLVLIIA